MSSWLRYFAFWRRDPHRDASEEIRFHLDMRVQDLEARGMSADQARRTAEREFGDAERVQEQVVRIDERMMRRGGRSDWWNELARDLRIGFRSLRASPAFTITAVATAALGIGVTAAIVSATYAILVRPLPYPDAERLVAIYGENPGRGYHGSNISWPDFVSWRDDNRAFSAIGMWTWNTNTLFDPTGTGEAERVEGADVTTNLFQLLGVRPARGRLFALGEDVEGANRVVLLSDGLWVRRFGADPAIVGKTILVDSRPHTVVGVMPPRFNFPDRGELWLPFTVNPSYESHGNRGYAGAIGRLRAGVTLEQARADLHRIDADLTKQFPSDNIGWRAELMSLRQDLVGDLRQPLKVFLWAVALVLLMVCANIANLMLARGAMRSREIAVRSALGATRARLARQLMTESLLVALLGGAIGVLIAWLGVRLLRFGFPDQSPPFFIDLSLDSAALLFLVAIALGTGALFGVVPALRGTRVDLATALRDGARGSGEGLHRSRLRSALVIGEVALSVMLMIGAILLVRSYRNFQGTDLGFQQAGIISARLSLMAETYPNRAANLAFYERLHERLRAIPGVVSEGSAQGIPFSGWNVQSETKIEGAPPPMPGEDLVAHFQMVTPDFFKTIGVQLVRGRWLTASDRDSTAPVTLVNETFVKKAFNGADPIGKRIRISGLGADNGPFATIVGVVKDYRHYRLPQPMGPASYYTLATWPAWSQTLVLRTDRDDPESLVQAIREVIHDIDPRLALYQVQTFREVVSRSLWRQRLQGNVLGIFAALSLALACVGLYGVISYAVAQRTRELGVRIALGATRADVLRLVFGESGRLVLTGVALGLFAAFFGVRLLESLLYGIQANDVATFASVPALLTVVALVAALLPARRATRVNPIIAMRAE